MAKLLSAYSVLLDELYGTTTDGSRWSVVMKSLTGAFDGCAAIARMPAGTPEASRIEHIDDYDEYTQQYQDYYYSRNVWFTRSDRLELMNVRIGETIVSESELEKTEFYNDYLRPQDLKHTLLGGLTTSRNEVYQLGLVRSCRRGVYTASEIALVTSLLPHMRRSIEIAQHLDMAERKADGALAALEQVGTAVLVVDADQKVKFANRLAENLITRGGLLKISHGRLGASDSIARSRLMQAVAAATGAGRQASGRSGQIVSVPCWQTGGMLSVSVSPLDERDRWTFGSGPLALVLMSSTSAAPQLSVASLRSVYGFTPAEARLATALCSGKTLKAYADEAQISITTVKWHLKSCFAKTGEQRQADLVRQLTNNPTLKAA